VGTFGSHRRLVLAAAVAAGLGASFAADLPAEAGTPTVWYAGRSAKARTNWLFGDTTCERNDPDCNQCIPNIPEQFDRGFRDHHYSQSTKVWHFNWRSHYPPSGNTPEQMFDDAGAIQKLHVQGFARTNLDDYPYVFTHSDDHDGGFGVVRQLDDGRKQLHALHETVHNHPSGLSTLGAFALLVDGIRLRIYDVRHPTEAQEYRYKLNGPRDLDSDFNGGVSAAKLRGGGYLVVNVTGRLDISRRFTEFFYVDGPLEKPNRVEYLGDQYTADSVNELLHILGLPEIFLKASVFSENFSLLTECGTGDLYGVYSTGSGDVIDVAFGESSGRITLARMEWDEDGPKTTTVGIYGFDQDKDDCFLRGGTSFGSVPWAPEQLRMFCSERSSEVNPIRDADEFRYREVVVDP
jgi:hypothetical protein